MHVDIEELKGKVDVLDFLKEHKFERIDDQGEWIKTLCPYHNDHNPSFNINKNTTYFHCWSCKEKGDIINLIMDLENVDFKVALKRLATKVGYDPSDFESQLAYLKSKWLNNGKTSSPTKKVEKSDRILNLNKLANDYYASNFLDSDADFYVAKRGFTLDDVKLAGLGYCPDDYLAFYNAVIKSGFTDTELTEVGLFLQTSPLIPRFAGRLIFPIFNEEKQIIGFSGRSLQESQMPKYTATPNSAHYNKSLILYGLNTVKKNKPIILVEGNFDYLRLVKHGFNVLAQLGSALTKEQCQLLKRLSGKVILLYDGDNAGENISRQNALSLVEHGVVCRVTTMIKDFDPDSYTEKYGVENLKKLIRFSIPAVEYLYEHDWELVNNLPKLLKSLSKIKDKSVFNYYMDSVSRVFNISGSVLKAEVKKQ